MKKRKVISTTALPVKAPTIHTLVSIIALDFWNASEWAVGAVGLLLLLLWVGFFMSMKNEEDVNPFEPPEDEKQRPTWEDRMNTYKEKAR